MRCATRLFFKPSASRPDAVVPSANGIPASFGDAQVALIRELRALHGRTPAGASLMLAAWTPNRFSPAQAECIGHLLALDAHDFQATLADAVHPAPLPLALPVPLPIPPERSGSVAVHSPDQTGPSRALRGVDSHLHFDPLA